MPLPDALSSVYKQYKSDNNYVASWLAITAKCTGYIQPQSTDHSAQGRLKGKQRKEAKKNKEHIIKVKDYVLLSRHIATRKDPPITIPQSVVAALARVIRLRRGFGDLLNEYGTDLKVDQDAGHSFFASVMEQVFEVLKPKMKDRDASSLEKPSSDHSEESSVNSFDQLSVVEISQQFLDAPNVKFAKTESLARAEYVAENQTSKTDALFALHTVLRDLQKLRGATCDIWLKDWVERPGYGSLGSNGILSEAVMSLGLGIIQDACALWEQHGGFELLIQDLSNIERRKKYGDDGSVNNIWNSGSTALDDEEFKMLFAAPRIILTILLESIHDKCYIGADLQLLSTIPLPESLLAQVKPVSDIFWNVYFIEISGSGLGLEDCFLARNMQEAILNREVSLHLLFAVQILMDTTQALGDQARAPYHAMVQELGSMRDEVEQHLEFLEECGKYNSRTGSTIQAIKSRLDKFTADIGHQKRLTKWNSVVDRERLDVSVRDTQDIIKINSILLSSPAICGLTVHRFQYMMYTAGHGDLDRETIAWVHLCNCFSLMGWDIDWPDHVMTQYVLGVENVFVGDPPKDAADCHSALCLRMGYSISTLAGYTSGRKPLNPRPIHSKAIVNMALGFRLSQGKNDLGWSSQEVQKIIDHSRFEVQDQVEDAVRSHSRFLSARELRDKDRKRDKKARSQQTTTLTPERMVTLLDHALRLEQIWLKTSNFMIHREGCNAIQLLKEACIKHLRDAYGLILGVQENNPVTVVTFTLLAVKELNKKLEHPEPQLLEFAIQSASQAMSEYGRSEAGTRISRHVTATSGIARVTQRKGHGGELETHMEQGLIPNPKKLDVERWNRWWATGIYEESPEKF